MAGAIEEVGARMSVIDGAKFRADMAASTKVTEDFTASQLDAAKASRATAKAFLESQAIVADSLDSTDASRAAAQKSMMALNAEQARSADIAKASAATIAGSADAAAAATTASAKTIGAVTLGHSAGMKTAIAASNKILKYGFFGVAAITYEGIKQANAFQQQITQMAIDAGVKKSQLPAFANMALQVSNATGLAATSVGDMMYRIASANPALGTTTKSMKEMVTQAANLYVLAGNTGNYDQTARMYGAIVSNQMSLARGGPALAYGTTGGQSINEWALATVGHGDMKMGDLVAAMGTGVLPLAKTFGMSLNDVGAAMDVLSPAMNANSAATRLKTAISMLAAPSTVGIGGVELFGGNAGTLGGILRSKGFGGLLNYLHGMLGQQVTGKTFANAFYGGGLGSATGGKKGIGSGAGEYLRVHGFTPGQIGVLESRGGARNFAKMSPAQLQAVGFGAGVTGKQALLTMETAILSMMVGGGRTGAAVMQLVNERGTFATKSAQIKYAENHTVYESALRLAYAEPIVKFNKFKTQLQNLTIVVGKDVTPAFDAFLSDLEKMGHWFGHNKWALKALGIGAGAVVAGAAAIKVTQMVGAVARGATALRSTFLSPVSSFKTLFAGSSTQMSAADIQLRAAQIQLDAAGRGGLGAAGGAGLTGAETGGAGLAGVGVLKGGLAEALSLRTLGPASMAWASMHYSAKVPAATKRAMGIARPWYIGGGPLAKMVPTDVSNWASNVISSGAGVPGSAAHYGSDVVHGLEGLFGLSSSHAAATAAVQHAAASKQQTATDQFERSVAIFGTNVNAMSGVLSPANIHALGKAGVKAKVARK